MKIIIAEKINGNFFKKDIISMDQFNIQDINILFKKAKQLEKKIDNSKPNDVLKGKIVTLLFYEPSSRTFGSFASAVQRLGGGIIPIQNPASVSSVAKGETLEDTIKTFQSFCECIIIRSPLKDNALKAAQAAFLIPVINAGDGIGEHPTQALLDMYTLYKKFKRLNNLTGVITGDLLNGRTVHSLLKGLSLYKNNTIYLLSPKQLKLTSIDLEEFKANGLNLIEITSEKEIPKNANFWYWTRVQKERFEDLKEYEKVKNSFIINKEFLKQYGNSKMIILHPLPRISEITTDIDTDPRAIYFKEEIRNGLYIRTALLSLVLGNKKSYGKK